MEAAQITKHTFSINIDNGQNVSSSQLPVIKALKKCKNGSYTPQPTAITASQRTMTGFFTYRHNTVGTDNLYVVKPDSIDTTDFFLRTRISTFTKRWHNNCTSTGSCADTNISNSKARKLCWNRTYSKVSSVTAELAPMAQK